MRASLPRLPDAGKHELAGTLANATEEGTIKICEELQVRKDKGADQADEDWATRARFQYCDMRRESGGTPGYNHAFSGQIMSLANMVRTATSNNLNVARLMSLGHAKAFSSDRQGAGYFDDQSSCRVELYYLSQVS
jgi:hypothetical protein